MEWVTGVKLTGLPPAELKVLVAAGQEAFLTQLLEIGFLHGDPHPGNLLKVRPQPSTLYPIPGQPAQGEP
jgi:predicted unusual protein kinase regulating ubiquinone biosynthesis (AarF/ABC1/UbiB family)